MKGIDGIKRGLIKLLKDNEWQEIEMSDITNKSEKVYYIFNSPCGNILNIIYNNNLSFHFGYDKCLRTSAGICIDGEQTDTEYYVVQYWKLAEMCIKYGADEDYVKHKLNKGRL